jgi:hypothetical protein
MARNLNELIGAEDAGYVAPLLHNEAFRRGADSQLAATDLAAARAQDAAAAHEDYSTTIRMFAAVKRGLAALVKRFPETAKHTDEAARQMDMAMSCVVGDVPDAVVRTGPAPSPFLRAPAPVNTPVTPAPAPHNVPAQESTRSRWGR